VGRYKVPRGPYQRHPSTPKEAALRVVIAERYKNIENETIVEDLPSIFGFPAFIDDMKSVRFHTDGSLSIHVMIPPSFVEDLYKYIPYIAGQPMAVTMEPIQVTVEDLTNNA
jgi:hypothetical protein